jgi:RNA polymerase sigma-70 factor (ECF subfamily)
VYRIAHNEAINILKKNSRTPFSFDFLDTELFFIHPKAKENSHDLAENEIIKKHLEKSLEKIPVKYKEILILYFYEEFTYKEISEILKIPTSLVGVRIQRGKTEIKKLLENKIK